MSGMICVWEREYAGFALPKFHKITYKGLKVIERTRNKQTFDEQNLHISLL